MARTCALFSAFNTGSTMIGTFDACGTHARPRRSTAWNTWHTVGGAPRQVFALLEDVCRAALASHISMLCSHVLSPQCHKALPFDGPRRHPSGKMSLPVPTSGLGVIQPNSETVGRVESRQNATTLPAITSPQHDEMGCLFGAIHDQLHRAQGYPCDPDAPADGRSSSGWPPQLWCHCPLDLIGLPYPPLIRRRYHITKIPIAVDLI